MAPITFGSLFAGIGGFDLGFERAGMECRWQVEIDSYANRVLKKHWPNVRRWPDVRTWPQPDTKRVDVICGGFPCQDISYAGLGAGLDGERSGLFFEAIRVVRQLQPRVIVLENVAALLTRGLAEVLGTLATIGFDAEWHCVPAVEFGAVHERDRIWIVAYATHDTRFYKSDCWEKTRRLPDDRDTWGASPWDEAEPKVCRMDDGVPNRVDRTARLGNAVIPQAAEWIGRRIVSAMKD